MPDGYLFGSYRIATALELFDLFFDFSFLIHALRDQLCTSHDESLARAATGRIDCSRNGPRRIAATHG
jgi:hypothetical protein